MRDFSLFFELDHTCVLLSLSSRAWTSRIYSSQILWFSLVTRVALHGLLLISRVFSLSLAVLISLLLLSLAVLISLLSLSLVNLDLFSRALTLKTSFSRGSYTHIFLFFFYFDTYIWSKQTFRSWFFFHPSHSSLYSLSHILASRTSRLICDPVNGQFQRPLTTPSASTPSPL